MLQILKKAALAVVLASTLALSGCYTDVKDIPVNKEVSARYLPQIMGLGFRDAGMQLKDTQLVTTSCVLGFTGCTVKGRDAQGNLNGNRMSMNTCKPMGELIEQMASESYPWYVTTKTECIHN